MTSKSNGDVCWKRLNFFYVRKTDVELNQNFKRSVLRYKDKQQYKIAHGSQEWKKAGLLLSRGGIFLFP